ncbi:MAG: MerR family transcriptional regulator [Oscillospiraceae bacterium]|nr:MerR family transcriptional regulator [Oscillospiraceae bacterium]
MELQTVRQVSQTYGISARMLRYYEQMGLLESERIDDYAYRVYDQAALKRLQQIVILRKLQIPIKQIRDILNNQNAVTIIEVFEQNISELDEKITALSTVKSLLARFVDELQEKAEVSLKLDILNDKSMISLVDALSVPISRIEENIPMEQLNKASETLAKYNEQNVRVVYLPPMTVVVSSYADIDAKDDKPYQERAMVVKNHMKKFIDDVDLFTIKLDTRFFGELWHEGHWEGSYKLWASIPDDLDVPAPLLKMKFDGGLYAMCKGEDGLWDWLNASGDYAWQPAGGENRPIMHEYINMFNRHGLKHGYNNKLGFQFLELMIPIKEIKTYTNAEKDAILSSIATAEANGKVTKIDLATLVANDNPEVSYTNGLLTVKSAGLDKMTTLQKFIAPLKVEMRAATDSHDIVLSFADGRIMLNHKYLPGMMAVNDLVDGEVSFYNMIAFSPGEFIDIEWIIDKQAMIIKINGEIQHFDANEKYIAAFAKNPEYNLASAVSVGAFDSSTVTVESLRVTEL